MSLTNKDYRSILNYYKLPIPSNRKDTKEKAMNILASKLCKCIKKLKDKPRNIGICKTSVLTKKGLRAYSFTCKKKPQFRNKKNKTYKLKKLNKNILKRRCRKGTRYNRKTRLCDYI